MKDILIIDDDAATAAGLADVVESWGFEPRLAATLADAREEIARVIPDLVILDLQLPDGTGLDLLSELHVDAPDLPVVMLTGHATVDTAVDALKTGAEDFATKPVDLVRLKVTFEKIEEKSELRREVLELRRELQNLGAMGKLIGKSESMKRIYSEIELVSRTDVGVLIVGESGTGKEVVANTIHSLSKRKKKPFVAFNCGAISSNLIESEIFGHEKGAFTNADKRRIGYFESAKGGTVFLDEITEMPAELQVKLLRVLEESRFRRVGGNDEIEMEARVIAATNRDPREAIIDGKLREDLYYRLNVFSVEIPPLRDRKEDIRLLATHFLESLSEKESVALGAINTEFFEALEAYDWPGNVRELRNAMQRALIVSNGSDLSVKLLPAPLREGGAKTKKRAGRRSGRGRAAAKPKG